MHCPFCGHTKTEVYNSRNTDEKRRIWRRRRCMGCKEAFTTYEASDLSFIKVRKRDGSTEAYSRTKLTISLFQACEGENNYIDTLEGLCGTIEGKVVSLHKDEVSSQNIAAITLETLKRFHPSPFIRYLSYRNDLASTSELKELLQSNK